MKKRLIYLACSECKGVPGVLKKIDNEIKALSQAGISTKLIFVDEKPTLIKAFPFSSSFFWNRVEMEQADYLYIRWEPVSFPFIRFLKRCKRNNPQLRIMMEIGMYPYDKELKVLSNIITKNRDKFYRKKLYKYIERVFIFTSFTNVFGIPATELVNCISVGDVSIPHRYEYRNDSIINLVAVATIGFYHGYDRLIKGIEKYYSEGKKKR